MQLKQNLPFIQLQITVYQSRKCRNCE